MFPKKLGVLNSNRGFEKLAKIILDNFKNGNPLELINENELREGKFRLKKKNQIFNPFDRKLIMTEINGKITDNQILYKIEMSILMKFFFLVNMIALLFLSIDFFLNKEYKTGFVILGFIIIAILITYFWLKSEITYLENRFQEEMKYV